LSARKIIVTGGAGFIGSHIAGRLAEDRGLDVLVCDWFGHTDDGKWRNLAKHDIAGFLRPEGLFDYLDREWRNVAAVVHMGAISATTETDVDAIVTNNVQLSQRLWDFCVSRQRPLVYASSAATYGDGAQGFVDDNSPEAILKLKPMNAYGWSKRAFDLYALRQSARGFAPPRWSGLRFFNVYGPNEQHKGAQQSVVAHMYPKALAHGEVTLFKSHHPDYPDGGQKRDFVYVRDCADVAAWLVRHDKGAGIVNVGTGRARQFSELAEAMFKAMKKKAKVSFIDTPEAIRATYQYFTEADLTRLRSLGYDKQFTPIEAGVGEYVKSYLMSADPNA
jgi:ADP-L-glycero-D-manno-heptose 6-epimerase